MQSRFWIATCQACPSTAIVPTSHGSRALAEQFGVDTLFLIIEDLSMTGGQDSLSPAAPLRGGADGFDITPAATGQPSLGKAG
jgi:hypothetical protein